MLLGLKLTFFVPLLLCELMFVFQCRPAFIFLCICGPLTEGLLHTRFAAAKKKGPALFIFVCLVFLLVALLPPVPSCVSTFAY